MASDVGGYGLLLVRAMAQDVCCTWRLGRARVRQYSRKSTHEPLGSPHGTVGLYAPALPGLRQLWQNPGEAWKSWKGWSNSQTK
jgi:hypothetical protein